MSGLPFLKALRKPELVAIAEETDFSDPEEYNKTDLVVALDKHLRDNQSIFAGLESVADYYARLSPTKRVTKKTAQPSPAKRETTKTPGRTPARRAIKQEPREEEASETEDVARKPSEASPTVASPTVERTNARQSRQASNRTPRIPPISGVEDTEFSLPASPTVVTEVIDNQTAKLREGMERAWEASGVLDRVHSLRAQLSSLKAIETIVLLVEAGSLLKARIPIRYLTTLPAIQYTNTPALRLKVPDLFQLLEGEFWLPISLWFLTCLFFPLVASYFINLSWKASSKGRHTRSTPALAQFDPLIFNLAKALLVHVVFGKEIHFGLTTTYNLRKVKTGVLGGEFGLLTGTAIGALSALYEAILTRA